LSTPADSSSAPASDRGIGGASAAGLSARHARRTGVALAIVYLVWGSSFLATKVMVTHEPPLLAAGLRFTLAGLLLGVIAWWRHGPPRFSRLEARHVLAVMAGSVLVSNGFNVLAMQHVASNVSAVLNATPALMIAWLGTFGHRASPLSGTARLGLVTGFGGVLLVLWPDDLAALGAGLRWQLLILVGCLGWSLATVYFRNATLLNAPLTFLSLQMLAGGAALLAWAAFRGDGLAMNWTPGGTAAFLWLTVMSSCLAYSAYQFLALHAAPVVVGSYAYVSPGIAALLGWLALDETLTPTKLAGMAVILLGVALVTGYAGRLVDLARRRSRGAYPLPPR
jgi:drug/metabolite transporter (DMT)-like permease